MTLKSCGWKQSGPKSWARDGFIINEYITIYILVNGMPRETHKHNWTDRPTTASPYSRKQKNKKQKKIQLIMIIKYFANNRYSYNE